VYEFYVLVCILENLRNNYKLKYFPDKDNNHLFPKAAADKGNYPYFKAYDKTDESKELFQICPGTKVRNKYNHNIHPYISFQKPLTNEVPTGEDLIFIIDAKHKSNSDSRVTTDDVKVFAMDVGNYEINPEGHEMRFENPLDIIDISAIITNGKPHLNNDGMLKDYKCIVVLIFILEIHFLF
jgi:hypothetical protein